MPDCLKWLAALLACAILTVPATLTVQRVQTENRARIVATQLTGGDPDAGRAAMSRYGCASCHQLTTVRGMNGQVGPSLQGIATRPVIASRLSNDPPSLIRWVRFPQEVSPGCGMPDLGVSERDGRDIAAYLYTLR